MSLEDKGGGPDDATVVAGQRRNSRRASEPSKTPQCTKGDCILEDSDKDTIKCQTCEKLFHFRCTGLPIFQIQHFLYTKNYRKFTCESCTKVAEHLKTIIPTPPQPNPSRQVTDLLKSIKEKQVEVDT